MKKVLLTVAVVATAAIAGWNYQQNQQSVELSDLAMENVDALANGEGGTGCRWKRVQDEYGCTYHNCVSNGDGSSCTCGTTKG